MLAGVVTADDVQAPEELCVTRLVKVVIPLLSLSVKAPVPVIDVVPVTVKFPVVLTVSKPVNVNVPGIA